MEAHLEEVWRHIDRACVALLRLFLRLRCELRHRAAALCEGERVGSHIVDFSYRSMDSCYLQRLPSVAALGAISGLSCMPPKSHISELRGLDQLRQPGCNSPARLSRLRALPTHARTCSRSLPKLLCRCRCKLPRMFYGVGLTPLSLFMCGRRTWQAPGEVWARGWVRVWDAGAGAGVSERGRAWVRMRVWVWM